MDPINPPPEAARLPVRRYGTAYAGSALCLIFGVAGLQVALFPTEDNSPGVRITAVVIGGAFFVLGLWGVRRLLTARNRIPRYEIDAGGIRLWCRLGSAEIPWQQIIAVGVGWKKAPRSGAVLRLRQGYALEVFVNLQNPAPAFPRAGGLIVLDEPPRPELPPIRLRLVLVETNVIGEIAAKMLAVAPHRWLGDYQRTWRRLPGQ